MSGVATLPQPAEGQLWADGINAGCAWRVASVVDGRVRIVLVRDGEDTRSFMDWPVDRWSALVAKQLLSFESDGGSE